MTSRSTSISALLLAAACSTADPAMIDTGLDGLALTSVKPAVLVPGTRIHVDGKSYVGDEWGTSKLRLRGTLGGKPVDVAATAEFVSYGRLEVKVDAAFLALLPAKAGKLEGEAVVEVESKVDHELHASAPLRVTLSLEEKLTPRFDTLEQTTVIYVNEPLDVSGDGLLFGGDEGQTVAVVEGCFTPEDGATCAPLARAEVPVVPRDAYDRTKGTFAFAPAIAGISPGEFQGTIKLRNVPKAGGATESTASKSVDYNLLPPSIDELGVAGASLGQYIDVHGNGFVEQTVLLLKGKLTRKNGQIADVDLSVVPEFVNGPLVRYVLNTSDALGRALDLRRETGTFNGTITPVISAAGDRVAGAPLPITFKILPVKQVIYVNFLPSFTESLRHFGLRALDSRIRARVLEVARRDYATVNVEFRDTVPTDFALYAQVDLSGPDPNQQGLFGYDNTPGKDNDNLRLFDRIGGVNATTQEDGSAGYGGVFIESLFAFSRHPEGHAKPIKDTDTMFDQIFDPFRPDVGGAPVMAADFAGGGIPTLQSGASCPAAAADRRAAAACAVWVMGSLVGTTMTHEVGHSLGLANPGAEGFHNSGDEVNRLMDAGGNRPFRERAELGGQGPARFCDDEYEYLRKILPAETAADTTHRPSCF